MQHYSKFLTDNGHELVDDPSASETIIVWTCAFREDVRDNSIAQLAHYERNFSARVIAAGCLPGIDADLLKKNFGGEIVVWKEDDRHMESLFGCPNHRYKEILSVFAEVPACHDIEKFKAEHPDMDVTFQDQFIKLVISEGCSFECTYCSERLAFPRFRSFPADTLVKACQDLVEQSGCRDVILLADSLGEYGKDIGSSLPELLHRLRDEIPDITYALNNLNLHNFIEYADEMSWFINRGYIKHLNLPIQSASPRVLKKMNRAYSREDMDKVFGLLNEIRFAAYDTHLIVGFPGETEDDFAESIRFVIRHHPQYVLLSKFMESPRAAASGFGDKISQQTVILRIKRAEKIFSEAGIICNAEKGALVEDRFNRLN